MTIEHTEQLGEFTINLELLEDHTQPDWDFENEQEKQELLNKIENGQLLWFIAKVSVTKCGVELADGYLGGCCYESVDDFVKNSGYYEDMKITVINEAENKIKELLK